MPSSVPTPERQEAGAWLKKLRLSAGLSHPEMAELVDCQKPFIHAIEKGSSRLPMSSWSLWAKVLQQTDEVAFARQLLKFYDKMLFDLLFGIPSASAMRPSDRKRSRKPITDLVYSQRRIAGAWLRKQRLAAGLGGLDLARAINGSGTTGAYIHEIEAGKNRLAIDRYALYARAINWEPKEFAVYVTRIYDPDLYKMLFGSSKVDDAFEMLC